MRRLYLQIYLAIVGILALFPVAIHTGKQIVQKSTAVVVAESVAEAVRQGVRNQSRSCTNASRILSGTGDTS